jgi:hypothetical protein
VPKESVAFLKNKYIQHLPIKRYITRMEDMNMYIHNSLKQGEVSDIE